MTFTNFAQASWGQALGNLRDQIAGETDWNILNDTADGGSLTPGDSYLIETPESDSFEREYIQFEVDTTYSGVIIRHYRNVDADNNPIDQWDFDPESSRKLHGKIDSDDDEIFGTTVLPKSSIIFPDDDPDNPAEGIDVTDPGSYWATTVNRGFGFYFQREVADGEDGDVFIGMCEVDKAWDYHNADRSESEWVLAFGDTASGRQDLIHMSNSGSFDQDDNPQHSKGNNDYDSRGNVNPDTNFDNYPVTNNVASSRRWRNIGQEDIILGTFNLWGGDRSQADTGHRDLIVTEDDEPVFTILKRTGTPNIILRQE